MESLRIGLIGASGRLGKIIAETAPIIPISRSTSRKNLPVDVLIDVSSPEALEENLSAALPIVIGVTGYQNPERIREAARSIPIFYAENFSLGAALLKKLVQTVSESFEGDIDLIETHHKEKKDAPSGTARLLAQSLPNVRIHSLRSGGEIGKHEVIFNNIEEKISISHQAHSRKAFAKGALAAARFLFGKPPGLYGMNNLIESKDGLLKELFLSSKENAESR